MILQEVLKKVSNFDEIWELLNYHYYQYEKLDIRLKKVAKEAFEKLQNYNQVIRNENLIFAIPYMERNLENKLEENYDMFIIKKNELDKLPLTPYKDIEEASNYKNSGYSLIDLDRYEALGYEFVDLTLNSENLLLIVTTIFFELTWFGFNYQQAKQHAEEQYQEVLKSVEQYEEDKKTGRDKEYRTLDEFLVELGFVDERTEEEKRAEELENQQLILNHINKKVEIFQKYFSSYNKKNN